MISGLEDIFSALCTQVSKLSGNEMQDIYLLSDMKEAKLACDVLVAHGFEAKLYADAEAAKLYVTRPSFAPAELAAKLQSAMAYARGLKNIKQSLDNLHRETAINIADYTIALAGANGGAKQIAIFMNPPVSKVAVTASVHTAPKPVMARPATPAKPGARPAQRKPREEGLIEGPEISREYSAYSKADRGPRESRTFKNLMSRIFVQNIASNGIEILMTLFGALVIVSLIVMSKGFLCPDLAVNTQQNVAWYCHTDD